MRGTFVDFFSRQNTAGRDGLVRMEHFSIEAIRVIRGFLTCSIPQLLRHFGELVSEGVDHKLEAIGYAELAID